MVTPRLTCTHSTVLLVIRLTNVPSVVVAIAVGGTNNVG